VGSGSMGSSGLPRPAGPEKAMADSSSTILDIVGPPSSCKVTPSLGYLNLSQEGVAELVRRRLAVPCPYSSLGGVQVYEVFVDEELLPLVEALHLRCLDRLCDFGDCPTWDGPDRRPLDGRPLGRLSWLLGHLMCAAHKAL
jgi:hypothetical protein